MGHEECRLRLCPAPCALPSHTVDDQGGVRRQLGLSSSSAGSHVQPACTATARTAAAARAMAATPVSSAATVPAASSAAGERLRRQLPRLQLRLLVWEWRVLVVGPGRLHLLELGADLWMRLQWLLPRDPFPSSASTTAASARM